MFAEAWAYHPANYRQKEVHTILATLRAGECISLIGLSGMGKSNLLGFLVYRAAHFDPQAPKCVLIDCNRLSDLTAETFFRLSRHSLLVQTEDSEVDLGSESADPLEGFQRALADALNEQPRPLALIIDSFDPLAASMDRPFFNNLRAIRDAQKFKLTYLVATRRPLSALARFEDLREFADLFIANQIWLPPLSIPDARWSINRFAERHNRHFKPGEVEELLLLSGGHPGLLRSLASGWTEDVPDDPTSWLEDPAVQRECTLLWEDLTEETQTALRIESFTNETLRRTGLTFEGRIFSPVFAAYIDTLAGEGLRMEATGEVYREGIRLPVNLTAKEHALLTYLLEHAGAVCEKDALIRAVWPEDRVYERGVRDDSLAQLVRRLRVKIEPNPPSPTYLLTVPGRGYRLIQSP
ncbi:MAG: AAA family ATPase [Anaerolineales bacterium]|nr:AAA family ATPase [Anaerolineales bacterium]